MSRQIPHPGDADPVDPRMLRPELEAAYLVGKGQGAYLAGTMEGVLLRAAGERILIKGNGCWEASPWLHRWYDEIDPEYGTSLADDKTALLEARLSAAGLTRDDARAWRPPENARRRTFAKW